jgi:hypothetical protein
MITKSAPSNGGTIDTASPVAFHSDTSTKRVRDVSQENDDRIKRRRPAGEVVVAEKFFACPFFKKDPLKYKNERSSCVGPGWHAVHRIK